MRHGHAIIATIAALVLTVGLAACSDEETETSAPPPPPPQEEASPLPEPVANIDQLTGVDTAVALDADFVEALGTLGLEPGTVGDGELEDGTLILPITSGNLTYYKPGSVSPYVQGEIFHKDSGLSLTAGETVVELTDFVVDPGASLLTGTVTVNGEVAAENAELFFLDGGTLEPLTTNSDDGTAVLEGTTVELKESAAELLNATFEVDALTKGMTIGVATITVALPDAGADSDAEADSDGTEDPAVEIE